MNIIELDRGKIAEVKGLWEELNAHHGKLSENFKSHFDTFTFENRTKQLAAKQYLSLFVASDKQKLVSIFMNLIPTFLTKNFLDGYCIQLRSAMSVAKRKKC